MQAHDEDESEAVSHHFRNETSKTRNTALQKNLQRRLDFGLANFDQEKK